MKYLPLKNQSGIAMLVTLMVLSLGTSFAFLAFQVSTTDLSIARYSENEAAVQYLAESGVEKLVSWASDPENSPDPVFFENLLTNNCSQEKSHGFTPDFPNPANLQIAPFSDFSDYLGDPDLGPFSELKDIGKITNIQLYAPTHVDGICTVEVTAGTPGGANAKVRVNIAASPMGKITAGVQGHGDAGEPGAINTFPVWAHWGGIRYTGHANLGEDIRIVPVQDTGFLPDGNRYSAEPSNYDSNLDPFITLDVENEIVAPLPDDSGGDTYTNRPNVRQNRGSTAALDEIDFGELKTFIKKQGEYFTVSEDGQHLLKNGQHILDENGNHIDSFDAVFHENTDKYNLVWIDNADAPQLRIARGRFKGYFYFSGNIHIEGDVSGRIVSAISPPVPSYPEGRSIDLDRINLEGIFAAQGKIHLQRRFQAYGAFYSAGGFTGPNARQLQVWYNNDFASGVYPGVRNITPLVGTWQSIPIDG